MAIRPALRLRLTGPPSAPAPMRPPLRLFGYLIAPLVLVPAALGLTCYSLRAPGANMMTASSVSPITGLDARLRFGRYTADEAFGRAAELCRIIAPETDGVGAFPQSEATRADGLRCARVWTVHYVDEGGMPEANIALDADTGGLLQFSRLDAMRRRPLGARLRLPDEETARQEAASVLERLHIVSGGATAAHWRLVRARLTTHLGLAEAPNCGAQSIQASCSRESWSLLLHHTDGRHRAVVALEAGTGEVAYLRLYTHR